MTKSRVWSMLTGVLAVAATLFFLGCSSREVKVGVAAPLTGEQAKSGKGVVNGAQLAVDDWNAKGGVLGKKVVLKALDDKGDPDQALLVARKFSGRTNLVVGHYNSNCTLAAEPLYDKAKTLMITPSSTNPDVTDRGYLTVFRVCGRDDQQGKSAAKYVTDNFPEAKIAVIHDKSSYGQDLANEFLKNFEFLTKRKATFYGSIDRTGVDIPRVVTKIKELNPTIVYFGGLWPQGAEIVKTMRESGMTATFISGDGCYDPEFINSAGAAAEGALVTFIPNQENLPAAKDVVARYKERFGPLGPYSLFAYAAVTAGLQAMAAAGTVDGVSVAHQLHKMDVDTPFGPMRFDQMGDPQESLYVMWKVEGGRYVEITDMVQKPAAEEPPGE